MTRTFEFFLHTPVVDGNKAIFSWSPNAGFRTNTYWIEYPGLRAIQASASKLAESYLPVCLALASFGNVRIHLPSPIHERILRNWSKVIQIASANLFARPGKVEIVNASSGPDYREAGGQRTLLFFGGGTESLLTLAKLKANGISPIIGSFGGPEWAGSNPRLNPDKFAMDRKVGRELRCELLSVRSNFREIVFRGYWDDGLKPGVSMMNAVVALPFFMSLAFPVSEQLGIGHLVNGNEKMNFPFEYFCFSPFMTSHLSHMSWGLRYRSYLSHLLKEDVCRELYGRHAELASYQYSCWRNEGERWCYRCQSCLEYYMLLRANGLACETVGMKERRIRKNILWLVWNVIRSPEGRRGEIWERICRYPDLRKDSYLRKVLNSIVVGCHLYRWYGEKPDWFKLFYRKAKLLFKRALYNLRASRPLAPSWDQARP